jgi:hypothetical protein
MTHTQAGAPGNSTESSEGYYELLKYHKAVLQKLPEALLVVDKAGALQTYYRLCLDSRGRQAVADISAPPIMGGAYKIGALMVVMARPRRRARESTWSSPRSSRRSACRPRGSRTRSTIPSRF